MRIKFSANLGMLWKELPLVSQVLRARSCDFDAVEFHDSPQREEDLSELLDTLAEARLPVCSMNTHMGESFGTESLNSLHGDGANLIEETIQVAKRIKAEGIHVVSGIVSQEHVAERYFEALSYALDRFHGTVYIEPISREAVPGYYMHSIEQAVAVCERLGNDRLRIIFDCFHIRHAHEDIVPVFKQHLEHIGHVQIASFPSRNEPSTGELNYKKLLPALYDAGYEGYISCEYNPTTTVEEDLGWLEELREIQV